MNEEIPIDDPGTPPRGVGPQLRAAREKAGLTIEDVAQETKISTRHLRNIEAGDFAALPGRTYAMGFAKNIAKVVGLDQRDVAEMVGAELDAQAPRERVSPQVFEPGDPARVPSARLGLVSIVAVVLLLVGLFFAARLVFSPAAELPSLVEQQEREEREAQLAAQEEAASADAAPEAATPAGPVVFTALDDRVWVKFYDGSGARLMEKEMTMGESYTVPADADTPQLWTGRPDALAITIGGREVPRIAEDDMVVRDVPVSAAALLARSDAGATGDSGTDSGMGEGPAT